MTPEKHGKPYGPQRGLTRRTLTRSFMAAPLALYALGATGARALPIGDSAGGPRLAPFGGGQVRLNSGPFLDAQKANRAFMLRQDPERLLHTFRLNAGLPTKAQPLGGWEDPSCELRGHFTGHYLSACALAYGHRRDADLKTRGDALVAALAACQTALNQGGYLSAFPQELFVRLDARQPVWAPFYTYHKILAGLLDMHEHAQNAQALTVATGMGEWVDNWTKDKTRAHMQDIMNDEFGGMNEALYNLARLSGDRRWIAVGDRFSKDRLFVPLAARVDELTGLHVNTHIPQVIGAARRYDITGDAYYNGISGFFWDTVTQSRSYVTGGSSNKEHWLKPPGQLAAEWAESPNHQECCCCYNMLKLTRALFMQAPQARYMDYYERNLLNHRLGTIDPQTGNTTYFLSMAPGAWKTLCTDTDTYWCCTGTGIEEFSKLEDMIYLHDHDGVWVNLFMPSTLDWREQGVRLSQVTDFPRADTVTLTVEASNGKAWPLHIRIPAWVDGQAGLRLNGQAVDAVADPGGYTRLSRVWQKGDHIELRLPMKLGADGFEDRPALQALTYGPVVLAAQLPRGDISAQLSQAQGPDVAKLPMAIPAFTSGQPLDQLARPVAGAPLTYVAASDGGEVRFAPLSDSWNRFAVYLNTAKT
ncbi:glycoside hydrolase family 127 protein [Asticcacaulis sp. EMRT-3]|uniref:glycoside hydrolase family 127 protein n=1 Tax=Asticcacaulis sp. EMRT-3 TaxID=3040349 RepID=UPI0024AEE44B|nr:glycoside hydrolase family 127 protein [Asticcacaulis sp. EMRT-3]MDI7775812.1 glycoside hydrolase family 127 protein [Asticcacaulis sp. EMRT-3]